MGIVPTRVTRTEGDLAWLQFKSDVYGPTIRVEWHTGLKIAVIDRDVAGFMLAHRYARNPTDDEISEFNLMTQGVPAKSEKAAEAPPVADDAPPAPPPPNVPEPQPAAKRGPGRPRKAD